MEPRICRKDVLSAYKIGRTTLWKWEQDGLHFVAGRIRESDLVWFLELRDAARTLGMKTKNLVALTRDAQSKILEAAHEKRMAAE